PSHELALPLPALAGPDEVADREVHAPVRGREVHDGGIGYIVGKAGAGEDAAVARGGLSHVVVEEVLRDALGDLRRVADVRLGRDSYGEFVPDEVEVTRVRSEERRVGKAW